MRRTLIWPNLGRLMVYKMAKLEGDRCIYRHSTADRCTIWKNRAIDDTSMKFGTQLGHALRKIFGYRAIADFSHNKNGGFSKMAARTITFDHLETQVFAFY